VKVNTARTTTVRTGTEPVASDGQYCEVRTSVTRRIELDGELADRLGQVNFWSQPSMYHPSTLIERVELHGGTPVFYQVRLIGPKLNKNGSHHKTQVCEHEWRSGSQYNGRLQDAAKVPDFDWQPADLPADVAELLIGAVELSTTLEVRGVTV